MIPPDRGEPTPERPGSLPRRRRAVPLRVARLSVRLVLGLALLVAAVLALAVVALQTDWGRERVRLFALERLRAIVEGDLDVARLRGDFLRGIVLEDVSITDQGEPFLSLRRLEVNYEMSGFLRQEILLGDIVLEEPRIVLTQDSTGEWNYLKVLPMLRPKEEQPKRPGGWGSVVRVGELRIVNGSARLHSEVPGRTFGPAGSTVELMELNGTLGAEIRARTGENYRRVAAEDFSFVLDAPRLVVRELDARATMDATGTNLERVLLRTPMTELSAEGTIREADTAATRVLNLTLRADPLALDELRPFSSAIPWSGTVRGAVKLEGPTDSLDVALRDFALETQRSRVKASGTLELAGGPRIQGTLDLAPLDPADARAAWPAYPLEEPLTGRLTARGSRERTDLEGRIAFGTTTATLGGNVGVAGPDTIYDVRLAVEGLDLEDVFHDPSWSSDVNGQVRVAGRGREPAVEATLRDTQLRGYRLVAGVLAGRMRGSVFEARSLRLTFPRSEIRAAGSIPLDGPVDVELTLLSRDLGDLHPPSGPMPAASFRAQGRLTGPRTGMDLRLRVDVDSLAAKGLLVGRFAGTAQLTDLGQPGLRMTLDGGGRGVDVPGPLAVDSATVQVRFTGDVGDVSIVALVDSLRTAEAHLGIRLGGSPAIALDRAVLAAGTERWVLEEPGRVLYQGGEVRFERFALVNAQQRVALDGTFRMSGRQDLRFTVENVGLEDLQRLAGTEPSAAGTLNLSGTLQGSDRAPLLKTELALTDGRARGFGVRRLGGSVNYAARRLAVDLELVPDSVGAGSVEKPGALVLEGTVPVDLAFSGPVQRFPDEPIDLRLESRGLSLAFLRPYPAPADSARVPGPLVLDVRLTGRPSAPLIAGRFALGESRLAGLTLERLTGRLDYADSELRLDAEIVPKAAPPAEPAPESAPRTAAALSPAMRFARAGGGAFLVTAPRPGSAAEGSLLVRGTFPVDLRLARVERRLLERPVDVRVESRGLTLGLLRSFSPRVTQASGPLEIAVHLTGTPAEPRYDGAITLMKGTLRVGEEALYSGIQASVRFDNDRISIDEVRVGSREGEMRVQGGIALREMTLGDIEAHLVARRFTLLDRKDQELIVDADIEVTGTTSEPTIVGTLNVAQVEWPLPERSEKEVINVDQAIIYVPPRGDSIPPPPSPGVWRQAALDLEVTIEDDAILKNSKALIVLEGELSIDKDRGVDRPVMAGSLDVVQGTYSDFGRRFEVREGEVFFFGTPDLNPGLNIVATTVVENADTGQEVEITLTIGGTVRRPTLDVSSQPPYEKSEIFSLLLFGTTTPGQGEEGRFQDTMARVASRQAAAPLQRALASELGLDMLEIQPGIAGQGMGFRAGKYIASDVFLTYQQATGPHKENQFGIQYRISRKLSLETQAGTRQFGADIFYEFQY